MKNSTLMTLMQLIFTDLNHLKPALWIFSIYTNSDNNNGCVTLVIHKIIFMLNRIFNLIKIKKQLCPEQP